MVEMSQPNVPPDSDSSLQLPTEAAYVELLPEISAVQEDDLLALNIDTVNAVTVALGVLPELRALRPEITRQLPFFDIERFDKLEKYALALTRANALHRSAFPAKASIVELGTELAAVRDRLLADALSLAGYQLVDGERLRDCKKVNGYRATATDVFTIIAVLKERWPKVEGKTPVTVAAMNDAGNRAVELLAAVGQRDQGPVNAGEASRIRQAAFSLFARAYDDARRAVIYLRGAHGDADEIAPSLYAGRGGSRRKPEEDLQSRSDKPSEPPESGEVPTDTPLAVDNGAGLPVTHPFSQ
jgi:hypothetical protein